MKLTKLNKEELAKGLKSSTYNNSRTTTEFWEEIAEKAIELLKPEQNWKEIDTRDGKRLFELFKIGLQDKSKCGFGDLELIMDEAKHWLKYFNNNK